ncbi:MAG: pirin family protein [Deltaproteobacteria bacterium]|nr:pirin family protein [Deltaproteobacteria bacterium]
MEGGGFPVRRPFPTPDMDQVDPFLLLDQMGPVDWAPGEAIGAPDHPHRGFETVTYVLQGRMQHKDSRGHQGELGPGDVQWMTAGGGVVHSEMPHPEFFKTGGVMHGFQLWVNLPRRDKMMTPRYQEIAGADLPTATSEDEKVWVRVVAGESLGVGAVIDTRIPITFLHFRVQPGGSVQQIVPADHNAFAWMIAGDSVVDEGGTTAREGQMALFGPGDAVHLSVPEGAEQPAELLLLAGVPLHEPVARYGPFVMNTQAEIIEAINDFRAGRMGAIDF